MKPIFSKLSICLFLSIVGCADDVPASRFTGLFVSHVDSYQSGTGTSQQLLNANQTRTGFRYGDHSKADWTADIKWAFSRRSGNFDVYRVECSFQPLGGTPKENVAELAFDGVVPATLIINPQLVISIEPPKSLDGA